MISPAAATGAFRAAWSEMELIIGGGIVVPKKVLSQEEAQTGDVCQDCGGINMVRSGSCLTCQDCGSNSGCG